MPGSSHRRPRTTLIIMILASLTVITLTSKDVPLLGSVRSALVDATRPIGNLFDSIASPFGNWFGSVTDYEELKDENEKLRDEIDVLKSKQLANSNAAVELQQLKEELDLKHGEELDSIVAQIATGPYSNFDDNTLKIDRGSNDGVKVGNPVVSAAGLVGRIESVTADTAIIRLITDPDASNISIRVAREGAYGFGHGTGPRTPFMVDRVDLKVPVAEGDAIVTSGLKTALYPKDLIIGSVTKVSESRSEMSLILEVDFAADFSRLNFVHVLRWEPEE